MIESFWRRRRRHLTWLLLVMVVAGAWLVWQERHLGDTRFTSGYLLLGGVGWMAAYRLRKRWPMLQCLGSSAAWLQLHIYLGLALIALFAFHIGFRWPQGGLEQMLAAVFVLISGSGLYGLYISRTYPRKLTAIGKEVIFEQIPVHRRQLLQQAQSLALSDQHSEVLVDFIQRRLLPFLTQSRSLAYQLFPTGGARRALLAEVASLERYLRPEDRAGTTRLNGLIQDKDDLDFHQALQGRLKGWLFLHVGLTATLLVLAAIHTLLVHVFRGGV